MEPTAAAEGRTLAVAQLDDWGLEEAALTTELIVSELITNAYRYSSGPVTLRLIRDRHLICEVSDTSSTSPICATPPQPTRAAAASSWSPSSPNAGAPATSATARPSGRNSHCLRRPEEPRPMSPRGAPVDARAAPVAPAFCAGSDAD